MLLLLSCFSRVRLCATLWTAAHQAPLSTGFCRQEYWTGVPLPSPTGDEVRIFKSKYEDAVKNYLLQSVKWVWEFLKSKNSRQSHPKQRLKIFLKLKKKKRRKSLKECLKEF